MNWECYRYNSGRITCSFRCAHPSELEFGTRYSNYIRLYLITNYRIKTTTYTIPALSELN